MGNTQHELDSTVAVIETAKKRCAAGIVRAGHFGTGNHPPYLAAGIALLLVLGPAVAKAQETRITRQEVILLDVSGSMSHKAETRNLFNELLQGVKQLLKTEPAESRTWTVLISTDSFGGVQTLVRGWTPSTSGIFVDRLNQARRQLVANFEQKAAGLTPSASGTDIFGAIARARALMDSEPDTTRRVKELFLFTDGVHETAFNMPALLPTGVDNMIALARTNRLIVPLAGVKVYVFGASTANLNPASWATIKDFWTAYFKAAGAELVVYSPEVNPFRK